MTPYVLTKEAEKDLKEIARYTMKNYGAEKLRIYRGKIKTKLTDIAKGEVTLHSFSKKISQVLVTKCEHHFIFYITENHEKPVIIGIIHETRDIISHIKNRL